MLTVLAQFREGKSYWHTVAWWGRVSYDAKS